MPPGSLARHLVLRLFPAVVVLVVLDLSATWVMTRKMSLEAWLLQDIFWTMVISQALLVSVFAWVLVSGVRSGLASINRLSQQISQRSIEDLQPLEVTGLPTELAPMVTHLDRKSTRLNSSH